jgi:carbamoylphosphate synthase large subunit
VIVADNQTDSQTSNAVTLPMRISSPDQASMGRGLRILLTDTKRWAVGVRIGIAFAQMGCEVGMLCPPEGHPAATVRSIHHRFVYDGFAPVASLRTAIDRFRPDVVLPTCDRGLAHLHLLHDQAWGDGEDWIVACIERSLGSAESYSIVSNRYKLLRLAQEEGIRVPATMPLASTSDLLAAEGMGLPLVVKADGTWGGCGVKVARTREELEDAYRDLRGRRGVPWLVKELALNRDRGNTLNDWRNFHPELIAQKFVEGRPANCAVACWEGKVLAGIAVEVIATNGERGPASIVDIVEGREMLRAAEKIARRLRLSGFFGLDFMVEPETGAAWLIEMNARSTQPCSLQLGTGRNLPAALCAAFAGVSEPESDSVTALSRIAYFPKPAGSFATTVDLPVWSYHYDIPADEPDLVHLLLHQWPDRGRLGQWLDRMRGIDRGTGEANRRAPVLARQKPPMTPAPAPSQGVGSSNAGDD